MNRLRAISMLVFALAVSPGPLTCTSAAAAEASPAAPSRVVIVGEPGAVSELAGRILAEIDVPGGVEIARAEAAAPADVFRNDAAPRITAWVIVDGPLARVRVADANRERFLFRELEVSEPLTELDRESVCQMLKAELVTVIEGGGGALARREAEQALGIPAAPPPPAQAPPAEAPPAPPRVVEPLDTPLLPEPEPEPSDPESDLGWSVAARYGVQRTEVGAAHGPGLVAALWSNREALRPGAWLAVQYQIEQEIVRGLAWKGATSLQAGAALEALAGLRVEAGAGFDLVHFTRAGLFTDQPRSWTKVVPVARLALRFGAIEGFDIPISLTALLDAAGRSVRGDTFTFIPVSNSSVSEIPFVALWTTAGWALHPGVFIDLWWR